MLAAAEETRIRSLAAMARALSRPTSQLRLVELAAEEARRALRASTVSISRLEPGSATVRTIINVGTLGPAETRWPDDETYPMEEFGNLGLVVDDLRTWVASIEDPTSDPAEVALLRDLGKAASLGSPIVVDGRLWGEFYATHASGAAAFDLDDVAYLEALTAILGGALARALREEDLERLAYRDPLTGLANRRALDQQAERAWQVPRGVARTVTVLAIDINRLKAVNDGWGHHVGDQLIQAVGHSLSAAFDPMVGSLVARVGGDEFTVLVSCQEPAEVVRVAEGLCQRQWKVGPGAGISCGAASTVVTQETDVLPAAVFAAADRALYVAKRARLRSVVVHDVDDDRAIVGG